jgi:hypothetical protein
MPFSWQKHVFVSEKSVLSIDYFKAVQAKKFESGTLPKKIKVVPRPKILN